VCVVQEKDEKKERQMLRFLGNIGAYEAGRAVWRGFRLQEQNALVTLFLLFLG